MGHISQLILCVLFMSCIPLQTHGQEELLKNADFEEEFGEDNWFCYFCDIEHSTDAHQGTFSAQISGR